MSQALALAVQQRRADDVLQAAHLLAQRRLRDEHPLAACAIAEELILPPQVLPSAELAADDDQEDMKPECGERPMIVNRNHPSWAEVNAEQQEHANDPESGQPDRPCRRSADRSWQAGRPCRHPYRCQLTHSVIAACRRGTR
jgi:hypothetical protein